MSRSSSPSTPASRPGAAFEVEILEHRRGTLVFRARGPGAARVFEHEAGGHRWQRVPPGEKRGRVHTSTVTVAVLPEPRPAEIALDEDSPELAWSTCRGTGSGGQKRNKTESTVLLTHRPTGLQVRCESGRCQLHNRRVALALMRARLWQRERERQARARAAARREQVGSGMRGDKRRTVRVRDGQVVDHVTGRRWALKAYLRGEW